MKLVVLLVLMGKIVCHCLMMIVAFLFILFRCSQAVNQAQLQDLLANIVSQIGGFLTI
jgi:hypothetical protein